ncbi:IS3 family transposase [Orrella sp. 11846]|uniref:IS3 family transposase n=1 Tax=Orrella sp. 11846 TaxID=3409913 RepID=UPI003B5A5E94
MSTSTRIGWISADEPLSIVQQCELAQVPNSTFYDLCRPASIDLTGLAFLALIDEEYTKHPFYGSRRMTAILRTKGHTINRNRVVRLMRQMGLVGIAPGPNTSKPHPEHRIYPYLLRGLAVWAYDR